MRAGPDAGHRLTRRRCSSVARCSTTAISASLIAASAALAGRIVASGVDSAVAGGDTVLDAVRRAAAGEGGGASLGEVLAGLGYEPRRDADRVLLGNCPFHALATQHTAPVCGMNRDMLSAPLDERGVTSLRVTLDPAPGRCCVVLEPAE